jgi:2-methylcitrate dehydratase PrpD
VDVPDFRGAALTDPETHRLAGLVDVVLDTDNPDQNALDPQRITVWLTSGAMHSIDLPHVYGHPKVPLTDAANEEKFRRCTTYGRLPLTDPDRLIAAVATVESLTDIADLVRLTQSGGTT